MPIEILDVDKRISMLLKNDVVLANALGGVVRLHADLAPEDESNDFWITFGLQDGRDSNSMGGIHVFSRPQYTIRTCVRDKGYQALKPAVNRIHDLLTGPPAEVDGTWVGRFIRQMVLRDIDQLKNLRIYWIAQVYDLVAYEV